MRLCLSFGSKGFSMCDYPYPYCDYPYPYCGYSYPYLGLKGFRCAAAHLVRLQHVEDLPRAGLGVGGAQKRHTRPPAHNANTRTNRQANKHTQKHTDKQTNKHTRARPRPTADPHKQKKENVQPQQQLKGCTGYSHGTHGVLLAGYARGYSVSADARSTHKYSQVLTSTCCSDVPSQQLFSDGTPSSHARRPCVSTCWVPREYYR